MLNAEDIKAGVPIATLGSIAILSASFLQSADFIIEYTGKFLNPFGFYVSAGFLLLLSSGSFLYYSYLNDPRPQWLYVFGFELPLGIGLLAFLVSTVMTLLIYLNI